jgi:hypothetical protein
VPTAVISARGVHCRRSDVRLLDSLIMTVQLNIRKLLQVGGS